MKKGMKYLLFGLFAGGTVMALSSSAWAVEGVCINCHTMHNSQDGGTIIGTEQANLLNSTNGCLGCHEGTNTNVALFGTDGPKVYDPAGGDATTSLAGGNFGWVDGTGGADANGHNVLDIAVSTDTLGNTPPGGAALPTQLSCASPTTGCHQSGGHHSDTQGAVTPVANEPGTSFRFLMPLGGSQGVSGFEDPAYEAPTTTVTGGTLSSTVHNQYKGATSAAAGTDTISAFCGSCHGVFHLAGGSSGAWTRHPTDIDLNSLPGTEYAAYNDGAGTYSTDIPVGSTVTSAPLGTVLQGAGDAIVTCLSCHRAHGSQYADALRFDYSLMNAHNGGAASGTGCFVCHTTKD